ncbi:MAG: hypothetical protein K8S99_15430 [Planctomycetes bacterium]|nr:hypothetical protein [Planctomycetota bacterium]
MPQKPRVFEVPKTRDPIVNTPLISLGVGRGGVESFWVSTYNRNVGTIGLRLDEWGNCRAYGFTWHHEGFYSAAHVGSGVLWLCGRLDRVVRLSLKTGSYKAFETGVPKARVFEGMIYDPPSGKLFVLSQPFHTTRKIAPSIGVSFDTRRRRTARVHEIEIAESCSRVSFPNGDGSYTMGVQIPGEALVRWDPRHETVDARVLTSRPVITQEGGEKRTCRLVSDENGRRYFPGYGWYHPLSREFEPTGPLPAVEMAWFARTGRRVLGALNEGSDISIHVWDWDTGAITPLVKIPDCDVFNVSVTRSGKLVAVNAFGVFYRFDIATGGLEASRRMPTDNFGDALAVCRIDDDRVIGTPYVSSRFWELNIRTGVGFDAGRAHTAWGQVSAITRVGSKTYMAAYGSGELMEYDTTRPLCYPDNPRRVADPPLAMRPTHITHDGRNVFYCCSNDYGRLGCAVARYDTVTGRAVYAINPLGDQQIASMVYDAGSKSLICGTTFHADSMSATPSADACMIARLDARILAVRESAPAPRGPALVRTIGPLGRDRWLCTLHDHVSGAPTKWMVLRRGAFGRFAASEKFDLPEHLNGGLAYAGRPGRFVLNVEDRIELWDFRRFKPMATLFRPFNPAKIDGYLYSIQGDSLIVLRSTELIFMERCLGGL